MSFFSGIPLSGQAGAGSSGSGTDDRTGSEAQVIRKLGAPLSNYSTSGRNLSIEDELSESTGFKARLRSVHRRLVGALVGGISGAATGGSSAVIFRPRGRIAGKAPDVARAAFRTAVAFSGQTDELSTSTVAGASDPVGRMLARRPDLGSKRISFGYGFGDFLGDLQDWLLK